jgi:glycosyltransferase involved in cell wall biosynthesis
MTRIAIVHDWVVSMRGGERVLESLCRIYPSADVFTLRYEPDKVTAEINRHRVVPTFVDRLARLLPLGSAEFRMLLPLFPLAIESLRLNDYDLIISSSHAVAKGARPAPTALHVSYVHSPMRYIWEGQEQYRAAVPGGDVGRALFAFIAGRLRRWDVATTGRAHYLVANSSYTRDRIRRYYHRDATVIEPPVDGSRFARIHDPPTGAAAPPLYLCVSALVPYKRVALAVGAMAGRRARLVVVGDGSERERLARIAPSNVELRGRVDDAELERLYAACRAVIHPAIDDFGIVPVEAMAAGRPVVAFAGGGALDSVRDGETGVLFAEPNAASLGAALDRLEARRAAGAFAPDRLRAWAQRFDRHQFEHRFASFVETCRAARAGRGTSAPVPARAEQAAHEGEDTERPSVIRALPRQRGSSG